MAAAEEAKRPAAAAAGERDELAESLSELFTHVSLMVRGELQGTNNQLLLLEKMNHHVAEEYKSYGDVASGLRVFVEQLSEKNRSFDEYVKQIDAIDQQVTEFEAVVSMLNKHVSLVEKKVQSAYHIDPTQCRCCAIRGPRNAVTLTAPDQQKGELYLQTVTLEALMHALSGSSSAV